ncbi:uncharacterized protein F4812DRAFT_384166 [Daldinia caldariorum]|uniref:uncharacterized protein n=1 Tax=Daldinia caldariorum TaxID=326644 RepID=UPI0020083CE7|nr:uncharacterized protein F4812DRAFT_384166 [Daldinia caldariorum]KAI1467971.1 hypothetical protein F4812DRAFT_384166 [Daldinia caldariorum]
MAPYLHPPTPAAAMLLIAALATTVSAAVYDNLAALDNAALFPQSTSMYDPGFGPRRIIYGTPAIPARPLPLSPGKARRQDQAAPCAAGSHGCLDLGPLGAEFCCLNDQYCYLDTSWAPKCCHLGVDCANSPCGEDVRYCNGTTTVTRTIATSPATTLFDETSVTAACCARPCTDSTFFLCQSPFGGQCCPFGARCGSNSACLYPPTSTKPSITPASTGCINCPTGGGCCDVGSTCTSSVVSATSTAQLCAANLTVVSSEGLSEGARVGIGVGVAVGASLIIGGITWFWIHRRRAANSRGEGGRGRGGGGGGGGGGMLVGSGAEEPDRAGPFLPPGGGVGTMSDITSPSSRTGMRPRLHDDGLAHSYYGPDAVPGPYTDRGDMSTPSRAYGIESRSSPGFSDQAAIAANRYPDGPQNIVRPVEMGMQEERRIELGDSGSPVRENVAGANGAAAAAKEEKQEAYELYGGPVTSPEPMTIEEAEQHRGGRPPDHTVEKSGHE